MAHEKCGTHKEHRLSCVEFDELYDRAQRACEVCLVPECDTTTGKLNIDHDRSLGTGAVRGLVCVRCNSLLGRVDARSVAATPAVARYLNAAWHLTAPAREIGGGAHLTYNFRADNPSWGSFGDACEAMGTDRSKVLVAYMRRYVAAWKGRKAKGELGDHHGSGPDSSM